MYRFLLSAAAILAFAGTGFAQTKHSPTTKAPKVIRGASVGQPAKKPVAKPAAQKAAAAPSVSRPSAKSPAKPQVRATRYGGFVMAPQAAAPPPPMPTLDLASPRTLSLVNVNTDEALSVTYWSNGAYSRDALDRLNRFLRDSREGGETEMDPQVFDILWHTQMHVGFSGAVEVLSAYRSPTSNAWLASVSRGVASDSQHINGNALDIRMPGVPVFQIRQIARSLGMGGVGFYPHSGFVHIDTGPVRYW